MQVIDTNYPAQHTNNQIYGGGYQCNVPLIDYFDNGYKLRITISGVTRYYLLDTGASDLIINRDTERELLLNGSLKEITIWRRA